MRPSGLGSFLSAMVVVAFLHRKLALAGLGVVAESYRGEMCMGIREGIARKAASQWAVVKAGGQHGVSEKIWCGHRDQECAPARHKGGSGPPRLRQGGLASPQPRWEPMEGGAGRTLRKRTHGPRGRGAVTARMWWSRAERRSEQLKARGGELRRTAVEAGGRIGSHDWGYAATSEGRGQKPCQSRCGLEKAGRCRAIGRLSCGQAEAASEQTSRLNVEKDQRPQAGNGKRADERTKESKACVVVWRRRAMRPEQHCLTLAPMRRSFRVPPALRDACSKS